MTLLKQVGQHVAAGQSGGTCDKRGTLCHRRELSRLNLVTVLGHRGFPCSEARRRPNVSARTGSVSGVTAVDVEDMAGDE